jgi:integrase
VPGYLAGRPSRNKGRRYPADPPRTEEIIAVMRCAGDGLHGDQARGLIVVLWRAGLRIQEALDLSELERPAARLGPGALWPQGGMDDWAFDRLQPSLSARQTMPVGPLFCVINGRAWSSTAARVTIRRQAAQAGVRRRFVPHQLRHAHAIELACEGVPLNVIQRQLGHRNLGVTSIYLQGIDPGDRRNRPRPSATDAPRQRRPGPPGAALKHERSCSGRQQAAAAPPQ